MMRKASEFVAMAVADAEAGMASSVPYSICFHAQQAAEKYLEAFLAYHGQQIPKTHNSLRLNDLCSALDASFSELRPVAADSSLFGVEIRYAPSKEEADKKCPQAWSAFVRISENVRSQLGTQQ